jgi:HK97 family phage major capsid protein
MAQYGGIVNVATVLNTGSGNPIDFATNDDTANVGDILAENTQVSETDTVFGTKQLGAYKFTSDMIRVSLELLQDNDVNLSGYLVNILAKRLGRAEANYFAVGTGTAQPEGLMTGATLTATAAGIAGITYADLLDLEHAVDPAYRANGVGSFVFNDATFKAIKGLMDSDGRPLWLPAISGSSPATILGYGYVIDQGVADIAASAESAAFGDISAFHIRRAAGIDIMRLQERYMDFYQHAFVGFSRVDSALLDTGAVAKLVHPAS